MWKLYEKRFYSEKYGREIKYFYSMKRGRRPGSNPSFGREDVDGFVYTQTIFMPIGVVGIFAIIFISAIFGQLGIIIGLSLENAGYYIMMPVFFVLSGIFLLWGIPRMIHLKVIRKHLDNLPGKMKPLKNTREDEILSSSMNKN